jgi:hypothetical protein
MLKLLKNLFTQPEKDCQHCGCCDHEQEKKDKEKEDQDKSDEELVKERLKSLGYL